MGKDNTYPELISCASNKYKFNHTHVTIELIEKKKKERDKIQNGQDNDKIKLS